jgi:polar amino acid transport system substrate-binding protein
MKGRIAWAAGLALAIVAGSAMANDMDVARKELAPTGKLRVGIAVGPSPTPLWTVKQDGKARGVTVDLGNALAQKLGVPAEIVEHASTGEITQALAAGKIDVGFMPVDDERKKTLDFSTNYSLGESTYLVAPGSKIQSISEIDQPGVRVFAVENTTTVRAARRLLKQATVYATRGANELLPMLREGTLDAIALGRDTLEDFAKAVPGARVLPGHFWAVGYALAVPKNKTAGLAFATVFMEGAKEDGSVRRALDAAGLKTAPVAPAGSRS